MIYLSFEQIIELHEALNSTVWRTSWHSGTRVASA
jgi:hypothetical protein